MVEVFREVRRVLKSDGTLWLNLGDSYAGSGPCGASYQSKTTLDRAGKSHDGNFAISKTLASRGLTYAEKKPIPPPGLKAKDLVGIPWRVAFALQVDGWWLRSDIIWHKPNPMPESVTDRPTKAHEYLFLLAKSEKYYYDHEAIKEDSVTDDPRRPYGSQGAWDMDGRPEEQRHGGEVRAVLSKSGNKEYRADHGGNPDRASHQAFGVPWEGMTRNKRTVWTICTSPFPGAHFATFPPSLVEPCILAGCPEGGTVLDTFAGSGTTGMVALRHRRSFIGIELNPEYVEMARRRIVSDAPLFNEEELRIPVCSSTAKSEEGMA